ncbi:arsinothricin resistance N-acetyltransferase ArsN1 family A [Paenibacillus sp. NFR01]|uniref:arsinothricin resistance N-acetyltransferase ArsN1 family A n=1 Tax=Paenibacillus sp. NFR01 TaxID=1566279 RepID=UPI0008B04BD0|nr:arsinothricin resistance N-acetyltransferase ArsN1 family A [Paenibacillus sp. NFR01]SET38082.1 phosphinothricin acetyltransferase [Paenibacillus sp. NFR01]
MQDIAVRRAVTEDVADLLLIYNQGIEDRIATLEEETKDLAYMEKWLEDHQGRHAVLVAEERGQIVGWASLNPYSHRCAYRGVADLSVYIHREHRGQGVGSLLLNALEKEARISEFYKIVLFTFPFNGQGQGLYRKMNYREVGVLENQGILDGKPVDVMIMEKLL